MKKNFLAFAVTLTSFVALINNIAAQDFVEINEEDMRILYGPVIINQPPDFTTTNDLQDINKRAVKNFHKKYPFVTNEEWSVTPDHGYLARFNAGGNQTVIGYNHIGNLHHTIKYYGEAQLANDLKQIIECVYNDYSITRIAEININDSYAQTTYVVYIRNGSSLKKVTICNNKILSVENTLHG